MYMLISEVKQEMQKEAEMMPFCPTCRFEYREGFTHCPDCGCDLVETLAVEERAKDEEIHALSLIHI